MPTLSSLLVQREAASMRAVEDAIARQVLHGGDLATNLLELSAVREDVLLGILAESFGIEQVAHGRLPEPPAHVLRMVPGELALRHGIFPIMLRERTLVLATFEPLSSAVEDDLGFALDVGIAQRTALLVRIRQAIADFYAIPLDRRFLRLLAKLEGRSDPSPSSAPPPTHSPFTVKLPRPISVPAPSFGTGVPASASELPRPISIKTPLVAGDAQSVTSIEIPKSAAVPLALDALTPTPGAPDPGAQAAKAPAGSPDDAARRWIALASSSAGPRRRREARGPSNARPTSRRTVQRPTMPRSTEARACSRAGCGAR
jgi:hypothetical protein